MLLLIPSKVSWQDPSLWGQEEGKGRGDRERGGRQENRREGGGRGIEGC